MLLVRNSSGCFSQPVGAVSGERRRQPYDAFLVTKPTGPKPSTSETQDHLVTRSLLRLKEPRYSSEFRKDLKADTTERPLKLPFRFLHGLVPEFLDSHTTC